MLTACLIKCWLDITQNTHTRLGNRGRYRSYCEYLVWIGSLGLPDGSVLSTGPPGLFEALSPIQSIVVSMRGLIKFRCFGEIGKLG